MDNEKLRMLEPRNVWSIFEEITKIPRCSGKENKIQDWLNKWAEKNHINYRKDAVGNVILTKEASLGCENNPVLTLQTHQDMVCEKDEKSTHNFDLDPIPVKVEKDLVRAEGTSLGADNGIGMAISMALLADQAPEKHGRIEALMTVEEETGLRGANNVKQGFFTGRNMINLDSEEDGVIIIGSAGGGGTEYTVPVVFDSLGSWLGMTVKIEGLLGGHSGADIHLPRANANKLMGDFLSNLSQMTPIRISRIDGGTRGNVIPRSALCEFAIFPKSNVDVELFLKDWAEKTKRDYPSEESLSATITRSPTVRAMSREQSSLIISIISEIHNGPFSWSKVIKDLVETSNNLAIVKTLENEMKINISSRSSDLDDLEKDRCILKEIGLRYGAAVSQPTGYPGWKADIDLPLLHLVELAYESVQGKKPIVTATHAGLECAQFSRIEPGLQVVSIGPTILSPHSPQEVVNIDSVNTVWKVVRIVAEKIGKEY